MISSIGTKDINSFHLGYQKVTMLKSNLRIILSYSVFKRYQMTLHLKHCFKIQIQNKFLVRERIGTM